MLSPRRRKTRNRIKVFALLQVTYPTPHLSHPLGHFSIFSFFFFLVFVFDVRCVTQQAEFLTVKSSILFVFSWDVPSITYTNTTDVVFSFVIYPFSRRHAAKAWVLPSTILFIFFSANGLFYTVNLVRLYSTLGGGAGGTHIKVLPLYALAGRPDEEERDVSILRAAA